MTSIIELNGNDLANVEPVDVANTLENMLSESDEILLRINGTIYATETDYMNTQCGGTIVQIYPVDEDQMTVDYPTRAQVEEYRRKSNDGERHYQGRTPYKAVLTECTTVMKSSRWNADHPPFTEHDKGLFHVGVHAVDDADLDVILGMFSIALAWWDENTNHYDLEHISYDAAYMEPTAPMNGMLMIEARISDDEDISELHDQSIAALRRSHVSIVSKECTTGACIAIHVSYHSRYEDAESRECESCGGSGTFTGERWDEDYEEYVEYEEECEDCEMYAPCTDDDDYDTWDTYNTGDREYDFNIGSDTPKEESQWYLVWGSWGLNDNIIGSPNYAVNWNWTSRVDGLTQVLTENERIARTLDRLRSELLDTRPTMLGITSNMGQPYYKTDLVMKMIAENPDFCQSYTVVMPALEATNPNENFHYIHGLALVQNPRQGRKGYIDLDVPYTIQGDLILEEIA